MRNSQRRLMISKSYTLQLRSQSERKTCYQAQNLSKPSFHQISPKKALIREYIYEHSRCKRDFCSHASRLANGHGTYARCPDGSIPQEPPQPPRKAARRPPLIDPAQVACKTTPASQRFRATRQRQPRTSASRPFHCAPQARRSTRQHQNPN
jgi:hypothetical protein